MKTLKIFFLLTLAAGVANAQGVKFSADKPVAGSVLKFTYNPAGTGLAKETDIICKSYSFANSFAVKVKPVILKKEGDTYTAEVPTTDSTTVVALGFTSGDKKDESPDGYIVKLAKNNIIPAEAYLNEGYFIGSGMGNYYVGLKTDAPKVLKLYDEAFKLKPSLKADNDPMYYSLYVKADKEKGTAAVTKKIAELNQITNKDEKTFASLINLYAIKKENAAIDSVKKVAIKQYPLGVLAYSTEYMAVYSAKNADTAELRAKALLAKFKLNELKKIDQDRLTNLYSNLANKFASANNYDKVVLYGNKIPNKLSQSSLYNSVIWPLAENNKNITPATAAISKKSLDLIDEVRKDKRPANYDTDEDYQKSLDNTYGMFADTYALMEYRLGNYKEALAYQEKAIKLSKDNSSDVYSRYITYLIKNGKNDKAFEEAEKIILDGKGTDSLKTELKGLYSTAKKHGSFDTYYAGLEKVAFEKAKAEWKKKMINEPAPGFSLVNLNGEKVSLAGLKGKTVILDYWATWCGPCVASFPGMQKALDKYKSNPNIVFLFINTWQREPEREKIVKDFMGKTKYTFNVLYDTKNENDPNQFDVVNAYKVEGIPTKFLVGPDGNIKFRFVGYSGSDDAVVKELDMMIALANPDVKLSKSK